MKGLVMMCPSLSSPAFLALKFFPPFFLFVSLLYEARLCDTLGGLRGSVLRPLFHWPSLIRFSFKPGLHQLIRRLCPVQRVRYRFKVPLLIVWKIRTPHCPLGRFLGRLVWALASASFIPIGHWGVFLFSLMFLRGPQCPCGGRSLRCLSFLSS